MGFPLHISLRRFWPVLLVLASFSGCRFKTNPASAPSNPMGAGQLTYVQIDVGQGDSELIVSPDGHAMLVDAGPPGVSDKILAVLRRYGVTRLDYLVESHPHADHIGSMRQVIEGGPEIGTFLASGYRHNSQVQVQLLRAIRDKKIQGRYARKGDHFTLGDQVTFDVLQPENPLLHGTASDPNNNSVVLRITYGDTHFLLTGDMEEEERERLLTTRIDFQSDVLKAAHHGSRNGIDLGFLRRTRPQYAIISCAVGNDYGHPHPEALSLLNAQRVKIFRTDLEGNLTLTSDGRGIVVSSEKNSPLPVTLSGKETASKMGEVTPRAAPDEGDLASPPEGNRSRSLSPSTETGQDRRNAPGATTPPSEATTSVSGDASGEGAVIGNRRSKVYHLKGMGGALPSPGNRVYFHSEAEAKKAGYHPSNR
jgi:beta-lactamase superfamily II metal-dependent hydrolase